MSENRAPIPVWLTRGPREPISMVDPALVQEFGRINSIAKTIVDSRLSSPASQLELYNAYSKQPQKLLQLVQLNALGDPAASSAVANQFFNSFFDTLDEMLTSENKEVGPVKLPDGSLINRNLTLSEIKDGNFKKMINLLTSDGEQWQVSYADRFYCFEGMMLLSEFLSTFEHTVFGGDIRHSFMHQGSYLPMIEMIDLLDSKLVKPQPWTKTDPSVLRFTPPLELLPGWNFKGDEPVKKHKGRLSRQPDPGRPPTQYPKH